MLTQANHKSGLEIENCIAKLDYDLLFGSGHVSMIAVFFFDDILIETHFFTTADFYLQFSLQILSIFLEFFALLLCRPHFLFEDVQDVGALYVGRHVESVAAARVLKASQEI